MTVRLVHRPARMTRGLLDQEPRPIEAPPTLPDGTAGGVMQSLFPVLGVMSSVVMMTVLRSGAFAAVGALLLVVTIAGSMAMLLSQRGKAGRTRREQRERYLDYLEDTRERFRADEQTTRARANLLSPSTDALWDLARDPGRLWERRRFDPDFLRVRVGIGEVASQPIEVADQGSALKPTDPFMLAEARSLAGRFGRAPEMPVTVPLDRVGNVSIVGDRAGVVRAARAMLVQTAALHAPDDVAVAAAFPPSEDATWSWLSWLPHVLDQDRSTGPVPGRRLAASAGDIAELLADDLRARANRATELRRGLMQDEGALQLVQRLLVVHDSYGQIAAELPSPDEATSLTDLGVTVVHLVEDRLQEPGQVSVRVTVDGDRMTVEDLREQEPAVTSGFVDDVELGTAEGLARQLAPLRLSPDSVDDDAHGKDVDSLALLGLPDLSQLDFRQLWAPRTERSFLRVPVGLDVHGQPVLLDLKESAQLGMGPHGLCVGATGSGKSELLRTLVLSLMATHSPEDLSMVLIDYKGGATFAPFEGVPHVAGLITNLEDDVGLTERAYESLSGEVQRRQQVLKSAGNVASITDYRFLRKERPDLQPLPHLFVIIDEFGELLTARPDFIDLFLSIGRIGRSIGVHLLLSSQRIESGKLRGLDTYLSYRLGLRTFSEEESRTVLDKPDAFHLPPLPGFGYLKVDTSVYTRFKSAHVSGPYRGPLRVKEDEGGPRVLRYPLREQLAAEPVPAANGEEAEVLPERTTGPTVVGVFVEQVRNAGGAVKQIWLPPMPDTMTLDHVAGVVTEAGSPRLDRQRITMSVPLGILDDPTRQRQSLWRLDLTRGGGHCAVIGGPQTGKTTLLRTIVVALALSHTPREVAVYGLDLVGGGLQPLREFPHVGGVAVRTDRERLRRTVEEVRGMLTHREQLFRERGVDGIERLREMHAAGEVPELPTADVVLVIDGFGGLRTDFEEIDEQVSDILQRGSGYGVHVVAGMLRWNDARMAIQPLFGTKLESRLGDAGDSTIDRKLAETISADLPGRILTDQKLFAQAALPRVDGVPQVADLGQAVESLGRAVHTAWPGPAVPKVRVLPHQLGVDALPSAAEQPTAVPVGVDETALQPVLLDLFDRDGHLLVLGDGECGKTNLLRVVAAGLQARYSTKELVFAIVDPRRGLKDAIDDDYIGGYAATFNAATGLANGVSGELADRMPEDGSLTAEEPTGPHVVLLVDDYDVLTTTGQSPLAPFLPYIPSGRDIKLHCVLTRRVSGASRGLYEPVVQSIREAGTCGLVMTGDRTEGPLFPGVSAAELPPGRGKWVRRGERARLVQTALAQGSEEADVG